MSSPLVDQWEHRDSLEGVQKGGRYTLMLCCALLQLHMAYRPTGQSRYFCIRREKMLLRRVRQGASAWLVVYVRCDIKIIHPILYGHDSFDQLRNGGFAYITFSIPFVMQWFRKGKIFIIYSM